MKSRTHRSRAPRRRRRGSELTMMVIAGLALVVVLAMVLTLS
jgi:predicted nucleic acid-binding Zn ribbon protein